ncbi:MAG: response regulator [Chloroflexota bacterium]
MFNDYSYLYVEDDPSSREVMQVVMIDVMGVEHLTVFETSENFVSRLHNLIPSPNLIFLDIHIAPIDGYDMLNLIRAEPTLQDATVIALTASVMNEEIQHLREIGFNGAIGKPINVTVFPQLVERILNGEVVWEIT